MHNEVIATTSLTNTVSNLIEKLKNSDWISSGLKYIDRIEDDQCPFCQSNTMTEQLVQEIKDYFDESYQEKINTLKLIDNEYTKLVEDLPNLEDYKTSQYATADLAKLTELYSKIAKVIEENKNIIRTKVESPSLQIELKDISLDINNFNDLIVGINKLIFDHNKKIENVGKEKQRIKQEFWEILRYEYGQTISNFEIIENNAQKIIDAKTLIKNKYSNDITVKEGEIVEEQKATVNIGEAVENIKKGLQGIGITDFSIAKHKEGLYRIVRPDTSNDVFTTLSEGEKMIISFLYFRELFKGKKSAEEVPQKKIAIIDDPVSSLSHIFVYNIGRLIKKDFFASDKVEQVFVLTHSLYFFYELTDTNHTRRKDTQKLFRLSKNSKGSSIGTMSYQEVQNDYHSYWSVINDDQQPPVLIANCMRNIIEYFFGFVEKIELSNVADIKELQENKFEAFMRYINRESHSVGQNVIDFKEFDYEIFREAFKLLFEVTGYPEHYEKMSNI